MPSDRLDYSSPSPAAAASDHRQQPVMSKPSPKILSLLLRIVIMSFLTSLFFLFLGIAAVLLVHLFLAGRHHRRRQSQFPAPDVSSSSSAISQFDLHHLPWFRFDGGSQLDSGSECVICLDRIRDGDFFRILPGCSHSFHLDCIDTWLVKAPACPICRARVTCAASETGTAGLMVMSVSSSGQLGLEAEQSTLRRRF
uniref:RING-type domain-containing protein n=1 Tax=Kalanchoe fedtschenkoi TaxID=63787 RepID=A0A7N0ZYB0_KALFE